MSGPEPSQTERRSAERASNRGPALLFWAQVIGNSGLFVGMLLVTRALGPTGRGTVAFLTVTALITAWIARLGVTEATVVFAARRPEDRPALLANSLSFSTVAGIAAAALVCGALWLVPSLRPEHVGETELAVLAFSIVAACLADAGYRFMLGCSRFRAHALVTAVTSWVYPLLAVVIWAFFGMTIALGAFIWAATQALRAILLIFLAVTREGLGRPNLRLLRESISFGVRAWIGTLADSLGFRIDQILLVIIASETALGFYVVAVNLSEILLYFPGAVSTALLPLAARSEAAPRLAQTLKAFRSAAYVTLATLLLSAALGPPLIPLVFGASFSASVTPFLLLAAGADRLHRADRLLERPGRIVAAEPVVAGRNRVLLRRARARRRTDSLLRGLGRGGGRKRRLLRRRPDRPTALSRGCALPPARARRPPAGRLRGAAGSRPHASRPPTSTEELTP